MDHEIKMNFYRDWINYLKTELERVGYSPAKDDELVSIQYFNLLIRMIPNSPRNILVSREFSCPPDLLDGLNLLKNKIEQGKDLLPHLSKNIMKLDYDDDLINDWDIHHLHLGTSFEKNIKFIKRTGPVLFVRFYQENAYLINIMTHGNWSNQDMIRIIHNNWPESIAQFRVKDAVGLRYPVEDEEIKMLREAHVVSFIEPEKGIVYMPPGKGLTTAGVGIEVVEASINYKRMIKQFEKYIEDNIVSLSKSAEDKGILLGKELSFTLEFDEDEVYAYEKTHGFAVELSNQRQ